MGVVAEARTAQAEHEMREGPLFGVLGHAYQPPRLFSVNTVLPDGRQYQAGFSVVPEVNNTITSQVYEPILGEAEKLPPGLVTSIYAPLRSYVKKEHPDIFARMQETVAKTPDKEYKVIGDPLIHLIMPLMPVDDQRMLLEAGRRAFAADFGFEPKGLWLPETAVSHETLVQAREAGYEFVPLRDNQIRNIPGNVRLDAQHNICFVQTGEGKEIAVLLGNSNLSGLVSYAPWSTYNAEGFLEGRKNDEQKNGNNAVMMMDLERFGHYQPGAENFLKYALQIQDQYGFTPLNMKEVLSSFRTGQREKTHVDVWDNSSWSCPHALGRWMGNCYCDNPSEKALEDKRWLRGNLRKMNDWTNEALDRLQPGWRRLFSDFLVDHHDAIFTGEDVMPALWNMFEGAPQGPLLSMLYLAKTEVMVGMTSCGWFFGGDNSIERAIPANMIKGVKDLFPGQF